MGRHRGVYSNQGSETRLLIIINSIKNKSPSTLAGLLFLPALIIPDYSLENILSFMLYEIGR
jgi:hypothetical protein